jgi:hypothetical protein
MASIAEIIQDYRADEIATPTSEHVDKWVSQFAAATQVPLLREMDFVLKNTYFNQDGVAGFLGSLVTSQKLAGASPRKFWKGTNFLNIQQNGESQQEMLEMFDEKLRAECGIDVDGCGSEDGEFVYLDDVMFSGNRVGNDLELWISNSAPAKAVLHVVVIAIHSSGEWLVGNRLNKAAKRAGKSIKIKYWRSINVENRKLYKDNSEVLWPAELPEDADLKAYMSLPQRFPFEPRSPGGKLEHNFFSSEQGRQLLERELLLAGVKIRAGCANPKDIMRPLGFSPFGLGFGSMIVTFRNCPNNSPLALWWGDPEADPSSPLSKWYPLLPRKTYSAEVRFDAFSF